ncbi:hypothetical protein [Calothrix sp. CCY 0018]|uniref:hypothetical protein n=1 Tax=Calothrix sp. CCY 0018 TaxID=3103864 RepID=UPI0039C65712
MNILDLNQIEVVEGNQVVGGHGGKKDDYKKKVEKAIAKAKADAIAFGDKAVALTSTSTTAVAGEFAASDSKSFAAALNNFKKHD